MGVYQTRAFIRGERLIQSLNLSGGGGGYWIRGVYLMSGRLLDYLR